MSKPKPARYRTTNWSAYNDALRKRGSLLIWLDKEMSWLAPRDGGPVQWPSEQRALAIIIGISRVGLHA